MGTEIINQGLGEAITSISRAPLPFVASTTVRNVKISSPGTIRYDDELDYQIAKRADSLSSGCEYINFYRDGHQCLPSSLLSPILFQFELYYSLSIEFEFEIDSLS